MVIITKEFFQEKITDKKIHLQVYKNYWSYAQNIFPSGFAGQGVLNKDPTVWLDGARSPPKYVCKYVKIVLWLTRQHNYSVMEIGNKLCTVISQKIVLTSPIKVA